MNMNKICVATCLSLAVVGLAVADATSDFKKWYMAGLPTMIRAMEHKDFAFFDKVATPDFTMTMNGTTQKRAEALSGLKMSFDMSDKIKYKYKPTTFSVKGGIATVTGFQSGKMSMKPGADKKKHVMVVSSKTVECWRKSGKSWMIFSITETNSKMTMDGKPMDPSMMGG